MLFLLEVSVWGMAVVLIQQLVIKPFILLSGYAGNKGKRETDC